jgi:hypothetical protein
MICAVTRRCFGSGLDAPSTSEAVKQVVCFCDVADGQALVQGRVLVVEQPRLLERGCVHASEADAWVDARKD